MADDTQPTGSLVAPPGDGSALGSVAERVYAVLQSMIMSLEIAPGNRLTVDALARDLKVSPTPVREALARLENTGLVVKSHLRGFRVADQPSEQELLTRFEVRLLLEPAMAAKAATVVTASDIAKLRDLEERMERTVHSEGGPAPHSEFAGLDAQFHSYVAECAGNAFVSETLDRLHLHLHLFRLRRDRGIADFALREHKMIVDAIAAGDTDLAEAAMRSHLRKSCSRALEGFAGIGR